MKQVTMESVKQRIAHIEDLNERGVGTKVDEQQFELACLRELVAATEQLRLLTEQRYAVVAELSEVKSCNSEIMKHVYRSKSYLDNNRAVDAAMGLSCAIEVKQRKTPYADAAIAALRAEAIRFAACHLPDNGRYQDTIYVLADEIEEGLTEFKIPVSRQLRESKGEVSNG